MKIISFLMLSAVLFASCKEEQTQTAPAPPQVKVTKAETREIPETNEWIGETLGAEDVDIRARIDGYIDGIYFTEGTQVAKGTVLYTIDAKELEQKLIEAQSRLKEQEVMLVKAESDVKRFKPLAEAGAVSAQRYETAVAMYDAQKATVEAANANVRLAQINLGYSQVTAPISGLIGISNFRVGDYVSKTPGSLLNTVSNIDPIKVRFSVSEKDFLTFRKEAVEERSKGNRATMNTKVKMILSDGFLYNQEGRVNVANREVDPKTGTLMLEASFPNPQQLLRPGQFSKIIWVTRVISSALVIPTRAITEMQGQFQVFVVMPDNKAQLRNVKKGRQFDQFTVIESGLNPGENVIVEGMHKVRPEMIVNPSEFVFPKDTARAGN